MRKGKPTINVAISEDRLNIKFPYNRFLMFACRRLSGCRYHSDKRCWSADLTANNINKIRLWKYAEVKETEDVDAYAPVVQSVKKLRYPPVRIDSIEGLRGKLYPFQHKGVEFLESRKGRALLADEMGLGKTVQSIAYLQLHKELRPAVIVVPASIKIKWKRDLHNWMLPKEKVKVLSGRKGLSKKLKCSVAIVNYDILSGWKRELKKFRPKVIIIDECHYISNPKAKRTAALRGIARKAAHVIALSGTPIVNRPMEFFNVIHMIEPRLFPSHWKFIQKYCDATWTGYKWDCSGAINTQELHHILKDSIMLRRLKKDVLTQLPRKTRTVIPVTIDNREEYEEEEERFANWVNDNPREKSAIALAKTERLKQVAVAGKMNTCLNWIADFLDSGQKLIVFSTHRSVSIQVHDTFKQSVMVIGAVGKTQRQEAIDSFQKDDNVRLFVGSVKAAGVGIDLTAASNVCFLEMGWTPADHDQAEDRAHRIGQTNAVNIWYLVANGTIENKILTLLDKKRSVLDQILDGKVDGHSSLLRDLLKEYRKEHR
jgi:SWI/SNF-related matrix-associated actin-dependent regulator 1 of chromatin subfamily A